MRAAALFTRLAEKADSVARDGSGKVVEVYPAVALRIWGLNAEATNVGRTESLGVGC